MSFDAPADAPTIAATAVGRAEGARGAAAALACLGADAERASLLVDLGGRAPRPTLLASAAARQLEERLAAHLPRVRVAARGQVCHLAAPGDEEGLELAGAAVTVARGALGVVLVPPHLLQPALAAGPRFDAVMLRAEIDTDRALLTLVVRDLLGQGLRVGVLKDRLSWVCERRALFGALGASPEGGLRESLVRRLAPHGFVGEARALVSA